jgi:hypothetical protein
MAAPALLAETGLVVSAATLTPDLIWWYLFSASRST